MFRMYGEKRSAGFKIVDTSNNTLFSMDIDINRPSLPTTTYELKNVSFRGVSVAQILADKVSVVSSNKVFRRIKDVIDLYYLSHAFPFDGNEVKQNLESLNRELGSFDGFVCRKDELQHAYEKFRLGGDIYKQPFELLYNKVKTYIESIIPKETIIKHNEKIKQVAFTMMANDADNKTISKQMALDIHIIEQLRRNFIQSPTDVIKIYNISISPKSKFYETVKDRINESQK